MKTIEGFAFRVETKLNQGLAIDPGTWMLILQIVVSLVKLAKWFWSSETAVKALKNPGWLTRRILWREVKSLPKELRQVSYDTFLEEMKNISSEEMDEMFKEVKS